MPRRKLRYIDAVRILGGGDSKAVRAAEALLGTAILGTATVEPSALGLLGVRNEMVKLAEKLLGGLGKRVRGVRGHSRTELLLAAHTVIVITAYVDTLAADDELARPLEHHLRWHPTKVSDILDMTAEQSVPIPAPHRPYRSVLADLGDFYSRRSRELRLAAVLTNDFKDTVDSEASAYVAEGIITAVEELPRRAVERYEEYYLRLAADCPEFAIWANLQEHHATQALISGIHVGLMGLQRLLESLTERADPADWPDQLTREHQADLDRPIVDSEPDDVAVGLRMPTLAEAYVNPRFRVSPGDARAHLAIDAWWENIEVRDDIQGFLAGHLTSPAATEAPLLVLGQPGSGKSVLTRVLAGRLPASDYLPVRVELRSVPADAEPQDQIEYALREATGKHMEWPTLVEQAGGAAPVVLFDGFDELLQSTGASHSNYLEQVRRFQEREAVQGRPIVAVVTSRTVVADHARIPANSVVLRLEPFDETQIRRWLDVWNAVNRGYFTSSGLRPAYP